MGISRDAWYVRAELHDLRLLLFRNNCSQISALRACRFQFHHTEHDICAFVMNVACDKRRGLWPQWPVSQQDRAARQQVGKMRPACAHACAADGDICDCCTAIPTVPACEPSSTSDVAVSDSAADDLTLLFDQMSLWPEGLQRRYHATATVPTKALAHMQRSVADTARAALGRPRPLSLPSYRREQTVQYVGVFLTEAAKQQLQTYAPPFHCNEHYNHVTLHFQPSLEEAMGFAFGEGVTVSVSGIASDSRVHAARVQLPAHIMCSWQSSRAPPHITLSTARDVPPKAAGEFLSRQPPAEVSPPCLLSLAGRLGCKMSSGEVLFSHQEVEASAARQASSASPTNSQQPTGSKRNRSRRTPTRGRHSGDMFFSGGQTDGYAGLLLDKKAHSQPTFEQPTVEQPTFESPSRLPAFSLEDFVRDARHKAAQAAASTSVVTSSDTHQNTTNQSNCDFIRPLPFGSPRPHPQPLRLLQRGKISSRQLVGTPVCPPSNTLDEREDEILGLTRLHQSSERTKSCEHAHSAQLSTGLRPNLRSKQQPHLNCETDIEHQQQQDPTSAQSQFFDHFGFQNCNSKCSLPAKSSGKQDSSPAPYTADGCWACLLDHQPGQETQESQHSKAHHSRHRSAGTVHKRHSERKPQRSIAKSGDLSKALHGSTCKKRSRTKAAASTGLDPKHAVVSLQLHSHAYQPMPVAPQQSYTCKTATQQALFPDGHSSFTFNFNIEHNPLMSGACQSKLAVGQSHQISVSSTSASECNNASGPPTSLLQHSTGIPTDSSVSAVTSSPDIMSATKTASRTRRKHRMHRGSSGKDVRDRVRAILNSNKLEDQAADADSTPAKRLWAADDRPTVLFRNTPPCDLEATSQFVAQHNHMAAAAPVLKSIVQMSAANGPNSVQQNGLQNGGYHAATSALHTQPVKKTNLPALKLLPPSLLLPNATFKGISLGFNSSAGATQQLDDLNNRTTSSSHASVRPDFGSTSHDSSSLIKMQQRVSLLTPAQLALKRQAIAEADAARTDAQYHSDRAAECRMEAAYMLGRGQMDRAASLEQQAQKHATIHTMLRAACNASAFHGHNVGNRQRLKMDLHGMHRDEAIKKLADTLEMVVNLAPSFAGGIELEIVTGWGKNSGRVGPTLLPAVLSHLRAKQHLFSRPSDNPGAILVQVGGAAEDETCQHVSG